MSKYITYEYWNPISQTIFYVGAGTKQRATHHLNVAKRILKDEYKIKKSDNMHKLNTILKLLHENTEPTIKIVYEGDRETCFIKEMELIKLYGRADLNEGTLTNLTNGGEGINGIDENIKRKRLQEGIKRTFTEEHKRKISESNKGKKRSAETKNKMSKSQRSKKPISDETREKMRDARKGSESPNKGKIFSEEHKQKISETMKQQWANGWTNNIKERSLGETNPFYGKKHTEETLQKIREKALERERRKRKSYKS